jgi:hypothetical protein
VQTRFIRLLPSVLAAINVAVFIAVVITLALPQPPPPLVYTPHLT